VRGLTDDERRELEIAMRPIGVLDGEFYGPPDPVNQRLLARGLLCWVPDPVDGGRWLVATPAGRLAYELDSVARVT